MKINQKIIIYLILTINLLFSACRSKVYLFHYSNFNKSLKKNEIDFFAKAKLSSKPIFINDTNIEKYKELMPYSYIDIVKCSKNLVWVPIEYSIEHLYKDINEKRYNIVITDTIINSSSLSPTIFESNKALTIIDKKDNFMKKCEKIYKKNNYCLIRLITLLGERAYTEQDFSHVNVLILDIYKFKPRYFKKLTLIK